MVPLVRLTFLYMAKNSPLCAESDLALLPFSHQPSIITSLIQINPVTPIQQIFVNVLKPNVNYSGRTAPLTSKVSFCIFIQQIYVLNILNMVYTLRSFLFKMQFVS